MFLTMAVATVSSQNAGSAMAQGSLMNGPQHQMSSRSLDSDDWSEETQTSNLMSDTNSNPHAVTCGLAVEKSVPRSGVACDACPFCDDICTNPGCVRCTAKRELLSPSSEQNHGPLFPFFRSPSPCLEPEGKRFTMCQVKRHNTVDSAWLVAGDTVYDATVYLAAHPGGIQSILRRSGGVADVTADMEFHSRRAHRLLKKVKIGKLVKCPREIVLSETQDGCSVM